MRRHLASLALLLAGLWLCACPPRRPDIVLPDDHTKPPDRPRVEVKKSDEADRALEQATATAKAAGSKEKAVEAYMAVRKAYPESTAGQEALYRAGIVYFEAGDFVNARKTFNELLYENPLFDKSEDAKRMLGESALQVGAYRDAYQTLWSLADKASGDERRRLLEEACRSAEGALLFADALKLAILIADEARSQEEQAAALARITDLVEGKVAFVDIARVVQELRPNHPAWPILTFKLARIYYHLRDWTNLEDTVKRFLQEAPNSPFAPRAQEMLTRFNNLVNVRPRRVGVILPMTGKYAPLGEAVMRGVKLALENSDVELVVKDTQGDVTQVAKAVEDLAFEDQAIAILGPLLGDDSKRAALAAEELQVPILTLSRLENITDLGPHVFRNMLTNSAQAEAIAEYGVKVMGFKSWGLLYPEMPYGIDMANAFWDDVLSRGGEIRGAESYSFDQTTFTTEVKKLVGRYYLEDRQDYRQAQKEISETASDSFRKRKAIEKLQSTLEPVIDFDALFIPDEWRHVGLLAPALAVEDIITTACDPKDLEKIKKTTGKKDLKTVTLFGSNLWSSPKGRSGLPELVERGGKFVICSVYVDGFYADSARPATKRFVKAYQTANPDKDPGLLEAIGYDSAGIFKYVIDKARPQNREEFRQALANVKGFDGATGKTSFDERREAQKPLFFLTIDTKGIHEIAPNQKVGDKVGGS